MVIRFTEVGAVTKGSPHAARAVSKLVAQTGARSMLDYCCGSDGGLERLLVLPEGAVYEGYEPSVPALADRPVPAELVCCIDILHRLTPEPLDGMLRHLAELCDPYGFFTLECDKTDRVRQGWVDSLASRFDVIQRVDAPDGLALVVRSRLSEAVLPHPDLRAALGIEDSQDSTAETVTSAADAGHSPQIVLKHDGKRIVFNTPNAMTAWRVRSVYEKEPDTMRWIEAMVPGAVLVDIGANVGMYTIFSAVTRQMRVYAFEPESQNYALLNSNVAANDLSPQVLAFPLALSNEMKLDKLYLSQFAVGGSCHSFAEEVDFNLQPRPAAFAQGAFSISLDQLVDAGTVPAPDYIKIDVDGIEHKVLEGAMKTLANPTVKSLLVELNTHLAEHRAVIDQLLALGFTYSQAQVDGALRKGGAFEGVGEFIFTREVHKGPEVDFDRTYQIAPPMIAEGRAVLRHMLRQIERASVIEEPFPYLVVDGVFPGDYYEQILEHFPSSDSLRPISETGRVRPDLYKERLVVLFTDEEFSRMSPQQQRFWRDFASWMYTDQFLSFFVQKFAGHLEPRIERIVSAEGVLRVKGDALLVNDKTDYAIGPHTDSPRRLVTFLFYLPRDDSMRDLGTSVYRPKEKGVTCWGGPHYDYNLFDKAGTVEFLPNRLMAFPKTERSFHGVEPIKRENVNRPLLINNVRLLNKTTH